MKGACSRMERALLVWASEIRVGLQSLFSCREKWPWKRSRWLENEAVVKTAVSLSRFCSGNVVAVSRNENFLKLRSLLECQRTWRLV